MVDISDVLPAQLPAPRSSWGTRPSARPLFLCDPPCSPLLAGLASTTVCGRTQAVTCLPSQERDKVMTSQWPEVWLTQPRPPCD